MTPLHTRVPPAAPAVPSARGIADPEAACATGRVDARVDFSSVLRGAWSLGAVFTVVLTLCTLHAVPRESLAQDLSLRESYWGPIPARSDSIAAVFLADPRPAWEYPLLVPYRAAGLPFLALHYTGRGVYQGLQASGLDRQIARLLGPKPLLFGFFFNMRAGGLTGFGGGVTVFHNRLLAEDNRLRLKTLNTTRGEQRYTLGVYIAEGRGMEWELGGGYRLRRNARFFGTGPESDDDGESFYSQETSWGGLHARRSLGHGLRLETSVLYSGAGARRPSGDEDPAIPDRFAPDDRPFGYGNLSEGFTVGFALEHDNTTETGRPEGGGTRRLRVTYFDAASEGEGNFWSIRGNLEQFVPLWFVERALALRGYVNWLEPQSGDIAFQRLLTNDEPDLFRGYRDFRWRDRGITAISAEYRWPLWANRSIHEGGIDAYLFTDMGQVFHELENIAADHLVASYGGGIRLIGRDGFSGRIEVGASEEEVVFRISSEQIFQHATGGLFNGRDQVALR